MLSFKEWLAEKEKELQECKEFAEMNEIFDYISDYKKVDSSEYVKYREQYLKANEPNFLKLVNNLEEKRKKEHGSRVHYYMYNNFLIYYGKFKYSNKYEIHFIDTLNLDANIINGKNNYSKVFSIVMSILKDKHFEAGRSNDIYIVNTDSKKVEFYEVIINSIIKKYKINDWFVLKDRRGLVISKNDKIITERDIMVCKSLLSQEDKELLDRLDENNNYI